VAQFYVHAERLALCESRSVCQYAVLHTDCGFNSYKFIDLLQVPFLRSSCTCAAGQSVMRMHIQPGIGPHGPTLASVQLQLRSSHCPARKDQAAGRWRRPRLQLQPRSKPVSEALAAKMPHVSSICAMKLGVLRWQTSRVQVPPTATRIMHPSTAMISYIAHLISRARGPGDEDLCSVGTALHHFKLLLVCTCCTQ